MSSILNTAVFRVMKREENIANEFTVNFRQLYAGGIQRSGMDGYMEISKLSKEEAAPYEPGKFFQLKLVEVGDPTAPDVLRAHEASEQQDGSNGGGGVSEESGYYYVAGDGQATDKPADDGQ